MSIPRDKRLHPFPRGARCTVDFEGQPVTAYEGEPLAVSLFASGIQVLSRSIKFHRPRGFFCLSGDCGACLMRIDGQPNVKACRAPARDGQHAERQNAWPSAGMDLLAAADIMFPEGMDHHTMMTAPRPLNEAMQHVVRRLGGLGRLPDPATVPPESALPRPVARHVTLLVVGAGPAGLAAATAVARALPAARVLVVDAGPRAGGSYLSHPDFGPEAAAQAVADAHAAGVEILSDAQAIGWYPEDCSPAAAAPGLLAVATPAGLYKLTADRYLYATGAYEQNALFIDNDRPGVIAGRAAGLLLTSYGVLPGDSPVVLGDTAYARALCQALCRRGAQAVHLDGISRRVVRAHGHSWIEAVEVQDRGRTSTLPCDLLAVATLPAPASELPRQHGLPVDFSRPGGFGVVAGDDGRTTRPTVFAAGDVTGLMGVAEACEHGRRTGGALAASLLHGAER